MASITNKSNSTGQVGNDTIGDSDLSQYFYTKDQEIIITIVMPLLLALGLSLNFAFLFVVARVRTMRTITNYYLVNLAISDSVYISFAIADKILRFYASPLVFDQTVLTKTGCIFIAGVTDMTYYVSLLTVLMFTFKRFLAVIFPYKAHLMSSKKRTNVLIFITWVIGFTFSIPFTLGNSKWNKVELAWLGFPTNTGLPEYIYICFEFDSPLTYAAQIIHVFPFFISMAIVTILNSVICIKIVRDNKGVGKSTRSQSSIKSRNDIVLMLIFTSMLFFILLFPFEFASFVPIFDPESLYGIIPEDIYPSWIQISRIMTYINCAINPIIYNALSSQYRAAFLEAFCCKEPMQGDIGSSVYASKETNVYSKSSVSTGRVGNVIPIETVSVDSTRFNTEDTVVSQNADNKA
ncbi:growth hormone secretagogue receptor type 1-like [Ptychodera flava]|uniref:growth hormone secretagogue receptor type 1-like n=1 Tax=Ptychodera flava TaxID=63121 RepID=UPI003969EE74